MNDPTPAALDASFLSWVLLLPALAGFLSGYQSLELMFPFNSGYALRTAGGVGYMATRLLYPICIYAIYFFRGIPHHHALLVAAGCGFGGEAVLRLQFQYSNKKSSNGLSEPAFIGFFNILKWYQDLWIGRTSIQLADGRIDLVESVLKKTGLTTFAQAAERARQNLHGFPNQKKEILDAIAKVAKQIPKDEVPESGEYVRSFCGLMVNLIGRKGLLTLLK